MTNELSLRVLIDGDTSRVYRQGDEVKGRIMLMLENEQQIKGLTLRFAGVCCTRTTRPWATSNNSSSHQSRRNYEEKVRLFSMEQRLAFETIFPTNKQSWSFEFTFPERTEEQFSRLAHGSKYRRGPHSLPPSFQLYTNTLGGQATVLYYLQARLVLNKGTEKVTQILRYLPSTPNTLLEPNVTSRVLYAQTWKQTKDSRIKDSIFTRNSSSKATPRLRVVPTLHFPEKIAPGQHIPLLLSLAKAGDGEQPNCILNSLHVTISTYTTAMCGRQWTQPEDVVSKHVTCISKHDINRQIPFSTPTPLTTDFRLIDDVECVPTFKTYTIARRYDMTIVAVVKLQDQQFTVKSTSPLEILPSAPRSALRSAELGYEDGDVDPLPLYEPREPSREFAPAYDTLYSFSKMSSTHTTLEFPESRSSSFASGSSTSSSSSTPHTRPSSSELGESAFSIDR